MHKIKKTYVFNNLYKFFPSLTDEPIFFQNNSYIHTFTVSSLKRLFRNNHYLQALLNLLVFPTISSKILFGFWLGKHTSMQFNKLEDGPGVDNNAIITD